MKNIFFAVPFLLFFSKITVAQVDLSKYYNSDAFKMSSTEYSTENDLTKFKEVNPEDVEGYYERGLKKMEEGLYNEAIQDFNEVIDLVDEYADAYYLRGLCFTELDSLKKAENDFNKAIAIVPVFAQSYTQLGLMYWKKDDIKQAKKFFDTAYEIDETDLLPVFYKCNIALYHEKNLTKTKRLLNKVIKNDSTFAGAYFYKAAIKMAEGYNKAALKNFSEAIHYNSEFVGAYLWRGFTYLLYDDILNAEADFSKLIEIQPKEEDFWALRSFLRIEMENYEGAVDDMVESVRLQDVDDDKYNAGKTSLAEKIDLKNALNYFAKNEFHFSDELILNLEMGLCYFLEEEYDNAMHAFEIAQNLDSTEAAPYYFVALIGEYQDDFNKAASAYTKALSRDKDIYDAYKKRGMIYEQNNDFRRAYVDYSHLVRLKPESKFGYKMRGDLKLKNADYVGAALEFNEALKRDSLDMDITFNRGVAREQIKDYKGAINDFDKVLDKQNRDSESLYHKAFCNFQLGDTITASILCDSSLNISTYNSFAHNLKGKIRCAQGRYHEGIFSYNKAVSMNSREIGFVYNRAQAQIEVKNWEAAIHDLDKTINAAPKFSEAYYLRGLCYLETENKELGISDLKEAAKLGYEAAAKELSKNVTL